LLDADIESNRFSSTPPQHQTKIEYRIDIIKSIPYGINATCECFQNRLTARGEVPNSDIKPPLPVVDLERFFRPGEKTAK
jgi:hypothetical protein